MRFSDADRMKFGLFMVKRTILIAAPPDAVWALVDSVGAVDDWLDTIEVLSVDGDVRHMRMDQGRGEISERVTLMDADSRTIEYEKVGDEGALRDYRARLWLEPDDEGTRVRWEGELKAGEGADDEQLAATIGRSYEGGLANLRRLAEDG